MRRRGGAGAGWCARSTTWPNCWPATHQIVAQTRRRVHDNTADGASRRVSLHDGDARPIAKGRLGKPVEFGQKAQIVDVTTDRAITLSSRAIRPTRRSWPRR